MLSKYAEKSQTIKWRPTRRLKRNNKGRCPDNSFTDQYSASKITRGSVRQPLPFLLTVLGADLRLRVPLLLHRVLLRAGRGYF